MAKYIFTVVPAVIKGCVDRAQKIPVPQSFFAYRIAA